MTKFALGLFSTAGLVLGFLATPALADELFLKNGDHITGKIVSAAGGSIVIEPDFAKGTKLSINQGDVATFTTAAPLVMALKDGTVVNQAVQQGPPGQVTVAPGGPLASQPVDIAQINAINPEGVAWHGTVSVNGLYARSSSTNKQIGVAADGVRRSEHDRITVSAAYSYGQQTANGLSSTNTNNWLVMGKYDYFVSPRWFGYANILMANDKVNFLRLRLAPGVGAGYQWVDRPDLHFSTEAGVSWVYEDYRTDPDPTKNLSVRLAYHADKTLDAGRISLFHNLEYLPSVERGRQFLVNADAGLRVALMANMYSELKGKLTYDNEPALGARKTTNEIRIGVGLTY